MRVCMNMPSSQSGRLQFKAHCMHKLIFCFVGRNRLGGERGDTKAPGKKKCTHLRKYACASRIRRVRWCGRANSIMPARAAASQKPVLRTSQVGPNSLFTYLKERVRCDLKRLKNRLRD